MSPPTRPERTLHQGDALSNQRAIPLPAVLLVEQHDFSVGRRARVTARFVQQHQRQQPDGLGLGQQLDDQPSQPDRLA